MIQIPFKKNILTAIYFVVFVGIIYLEIFKITSISDSIAFWSSIISLCSFLGLLYTVKLQMNEMIDNRKEFQIMNFNDIFFNLINTQNQIRDSIKYTCIKNRFDSMENDIDTNQGVDFFELITDIESMFKLKTLTKHPTKEFDNQAFSSTEFDYKICIFYKIQQKEWEKIKNAENLHELISIVMLIFVTKHQKSFLHYITHLENLLDVVINNAPKDSTYNYSNYIKSQLTSSELTFLYYISHLRTNLMGSLKATQILKDPVHQFISDEHYEYFKEVFK